MNKLKYNSSCSKSSLHIIVYCCLLFGCQQKSEQYSASESIMSVMDTLVAIQDFEQLEVVGYVPTYRDEDREVIAINSVEYPGEFGAVETVWRKKSGIYDVTIETMPEEDGESTYQFFVNGELKGGFVNPETDSAFGNATHLWNKIEINIGDTIRVASSAHTNNMIPENDGFAWARGRWSKLIFKYID